ncbi:cotranscriptional regulator FAM172A-like, partial [Diaphorina citri]|uniref:Cotranscriptional regulator FAM172A-like n=1 Tax=Diaphorina citri TaxID=121845 RepID=A0A1S3DP54_DIACI
MTSGSSKKSKFTFPKTMIELGYNFDENGELKKIDKSTGDLTKNPFEFHISDDADHNQKHYEALGEAITNYVYDLLTEEGLDKVRVPPVQPNSDPTLSSFIFTSPDYEKSEKLMVLIHGSGVVRAGQWARSIIINKDLKSGTQLSYIRKAKDEGYGVIVMNTNDNTRDGVRIPVSKLFGRYGKFVFYLHIIIINKDLKSGTQLSYIRKAKDEGYGVIVMNTNDNTRDGVRIP